MVLINDFSNQLILITGGTQGIGLATGLAFAKLGSQVVLTYRFGSANLDKVKREFKRNECLEPWIFQSDAANEQDVIELLEKIKSKKKMIFAFISNVAFGPTVSKIEDYSEKDLNNCVKYTSWPLFNITLAIKRAFGKYPRYAIGLSSFGNERYLYNYDILSVGKAVEESLVKYFNYRLFYEDIRINLVKPQFIKTDSLAMTMGEEFLSFAKKYATPGLVIEAKDVANAICALCSGLMDGVSGEILRLDGGSAFSDNIMRYYEERDKFNM